MRAHGCSTFRAVPAPVTGPLRPASIDPIVGQANLRQNVPTYANTKAMTDYGRSNVVSNLHREKLGVSAIVFFVLASVAPIGGVIGGSPVVFGAAGHSAPATFILVGALFVTFSMGYLAMSQHVVSAGGFATYVSKGLGRRAATAIGAVTLLAYTALICGLWGFFGGITGFVSSHLLGIVIPAPVGCAAVLCLVTILTYLGVDASLRVLGVLLLLEMSVLVPLCVAILHQGGAAGIDLSSFRPSGLSVPGFGIALLFATTNFTGFEATVVFSEEAKTPHRTIPIAAYIAIAIIASFYTIVTWCISIGYGAAHVQAAALANPEAFVFNLASRYVGNWLVTTMTILILTSLIAMLLGFHNIASRYIFALARAGFLPEYLGLANAATGTPQRAAICTSVIVLVIIGIFMAFGADPMTVIYPWLVSLGTVGILAMLIVTSVSVIAFFRRAPIDSRVLNTKIAPGIAALGFLFLGYMAITNYDALLGGQGGVARWLLLLVPSAGLLGWRIASRKIAAGLRLDYESNP